MCTVLLTVSIGIMGRRGGRVFETNEFFLIHARTLVMWLL